ncbi:hypothetical protein K435DRAFT_809720 [Dendrothele bispora CBS 962.96]|uniref:Uncharacterized protein n=1 Tax=Dendrothele bispora (strain CBS 962.96) TaxID=1314807 RepID=A0A4S8KXR2_DENBC|nr:hypothetical protein K435DRAFT_809720 [Dendrothele bispora CBS 962.96]
MRARLLRKERVTRCESNWRQTGSCLVAKALSRGSPKGDAKLKPALANRWVRGKGGKRKNKKLTIELYVRWVKRERTRKDVPIELYVRWVKRERTRGKKESKTTQAIYCSTVQASGGMKQSSGQSSDTNDVSEKGGQYTVVYNGPKSPRCIDRGQL